MTRIRRLFVTPLPMLAIVGVLLAAGFAGTPVAGFTEKPSFCATCHEMKPYYAAWSVGGHKDVACVACHVDPGTVANAKHKVAALKEVYDHVAGDPRFPRGDSSVPDSRCLACHTSLPAVTKSGFQHSLHIGQSTCVSCHATAGHQVSLESLKAAGVLAQVATRPRVLPSAEGTAAAHVVVTCTRCHDLAKYACSACHMQPHAPRGACETCHLQGATWAFTHPASTTCETCHTPPANHHTGFPCTTCHTKTVAFAKTVFTHPASGACSSCHKLPAGHRSTASYACESCHTQRGVSWAFSHPDSQRCTACHSAPSSHFGSDCASCHKPSVAFAASTWRHPSATSCASCHKPPSGHRTSNCYSCHKRPGKSWAFTHPSSSACSSCHKAPASHFGTTCSQCHSPSRAWTSANFNHPSTHHDWRSMACSNCHPKGPPAVGCTCHGGSPNGPGGD